MNRPERLTEIERSTLRLAGVSLGSRLYTKLIELSDYFESLPTYAYKPLDQVRVGDIIYGPGIFASRLHKVLSVVPFMGGSEKIELSLELIERTKEPRESSLIPDCLEDT